MLYIFDMGGVVTSTAVVIPKICELLGLSKEKFTNALSRCRRASAAV